MAKLTTFLRRLTTNTAALRRFNKDPIAAMKAAGLSQEHHELVCGRRVAKLSRALRAENPKAKKPIVCVVFIDETHPCWDMSDEAASRKGKRSKAGKSKRLKSRQGRR